MSTIFSIKVKASKPQDRSKFVEERKKVCVCVCVRARVRVRVCKNLRSKEEVIQTLDVKTLDVDAVLVEI